MFEDILFDYLKEKIVSPYIHLDESLINGIDKLPLDENTKKRFKDMLIEYKNAGEAIKMLSKIIGGMKNGGC